MTQCPLCSAHQVEPYYRSAERAPVRSYHRCQRCGLVFVPPEEHLDPSAEKARYDLHRNDEKDPGYLTFLGRLADPMLSRVSAGAAGLDFGSGPTPALAGLFRSNGHSVVVYDPFYAPDPEALAGSYDFITATEVAEHLQRPGYELQRLWRCLRPGGTLGLMTQLLPAGDEFPTWHYIRDPTHICFFSRRSFEWFGGAVGADVEFLPHGVVFLKNRGPSA